jgi:RNA polymerase sigma-70 factor, ECF subfamily
MEDEKRVIKAIKGNDKAFYVLLYKERKKLYYIAYQYVKNADDAIEIVQETTFKAFKSIKSLKEPNYFSTWLIKILINTALDYIKKNRKAIPIEDMEQCTAPTNTSHEQIDTKIDLMDALDRLSDNYKTVIILRFYQDLTIKQISEVLNTPEGTIKTHLHRAIHQLKKELCKKEGIVNG